MTDSVPVDPDRAGADVGAAYCLRCGYDLRGLDELNLRCPECGLMHSLSEPDARFVAHTARRLRRVWRYSDALAAGAMLVTLASMLVLPVMPELMIVPLVMIAVWLTATVLNPICSGGALRWVVTRQVLIAGIGAILLFEVVFWEVFVLSSAAPAFPTGYIAGHTLAALVIIVVCLFRIRIVGRRIKGLLEPQAHAIARTNYLERLRTPPALRGGFFVDRRFRAALRD